MKEFGFAVWTGPTQVQPMAGLFREAGIDVFLEGTERVYITVKADDRESAECVFFDRLHAKHDSTFGLRLRDLSRTGNLD